MLCHGLSYYDMLMSYMLYDDYVCNAGYDSTLNVNVNFVFLQFITSS